MVILAAVVAGLSGFVLVDPPGKLIKELAYWAGFTALGEPNLNGVQDTSRILAYVIWSLPYEWFFYLSLPLIALAFRVRSSAPYLVLRSSAERGVAPARARLARRATPWQPAPAAAAA